MLCTLHIDLTNLVAAACHAYVIQSVAWICAMHGCLLINGKISLGFSLSLFIFFFHFSLCVWSRSFLLNSLLQSVCEMKYFAHDERSALKMCCKWVQFFFYVTHTTYQINEWVSTRNECSESVFKRLNLKMMHIFTLRESVYKKMHTIILDRPMATTERWTNARPSTQIHVHLNALPWLYIMFVYIRLS